MPKFEVSGFEIDLFVYCFVSQNIRLRDMGMRDVLLNTSWYLYFWGPQDGIGAGLK